MGVCEHFHIVTTERNNYVVETSENHCCSCPDFKGRSEARKSFFACKHMYYVHMQVIGLDMHENMFMHQPCLGKKDVMFALTYPRLQQ